MRLADSKVVTMIEELTKTSIRKLEEAVASSLSVRVLGDAMQWVTDGGPRRGGLILAVLAAPWALKFLLEGRSSIVSSVFALLLASTILGLVGCREKSWRILWEGTLLSRILPSPRHTSGDEDAG